LSLNGILPADSKLDRERCRTATGLYRSRSSIRRSYSGRDEDGLIFGAAKAGTPLMQSVQTIGIDLPLKVLVWQDDAGTTFLSYNDPAYLTHRHGLGDSEKPAAEAMSAALKAIATKATSAP
jgi:hypothetical protein